MPLFVVARLLIKNLFLEGLLAVVWLFVPLATVGTAAATGVPAAFVVEVVDRGGFGVVFSPLAGFELVLEIGLGSRSTTAEGDEPPSGISVAEDGLVMGGDCATLGSVETAAMPLKMSLIACSA